MHIGNHIGSMKTYLGLLINYVFGNNRGLKLIAPMNRYTGNILEQYYRFVDGSLLET